MTALDKYLASVKARAVAATPGPWGHFGGAALASGKVVAECANGDHGPAEWAENAVFIAHARTDIDRLVEMVEAARKLSRGIAAEYADQTQGPPETLGKIAMHAEEYDDELDRIAAGGET